MSELQDIAALVAKAPLDENGNVPQRTIAEFEEAAALRRGTWEELSVAKGYSVGFLAKDWPAVPWYKRLWRRLSPPRFEVDRSALCLRPGRKPHAGNPAAAGRPSGTNSLGPRESADP